MCLRPQTVEKEIGVSTKDKTEVKTVKRNVNIPAEVPVNIPVNAAVNIPVNVAANVTSNNECDALTKNGTRCKRKAIQGSKFCWQHSK